ncbi:MAG: LytTR family transcriptional regulator [Bacteroidales bacterium]|nr:LytTR family transcriptional regulator [Bacteroidales bacterium]
MNTRFNRIVKVMNEKVKIMLGISFAVFLFILFFQPFPGDRFDFNNRLLFVAGFGAIIFIIMFLVKIVWLWISNRIRHDGDRAETDPYLSGLIVLILSSVAFNFYLRYVGMVSISFYVVFKVALICLIAPVILILYDKHSKLTNLKDSLSLKIEALEKKILLYEEESLNKSIEFISETGPDKLSLSIAEIVFVRSADNYVEVTYKEGENFRKKLIRNTLKNVEIQLRQYPNFIRCHRTFIVNLHHVGKLHHESGQHWLSIKGADEKIPVSRQYLLKLKELF